MFIFLQRHNNAIHCRIDQVNRVFQNNITYASNFGVEKDIFNGVDITMQLRLPAGGQLSGGISTGREESSRCYTIDSPGGPSVLSLSGATQPGAAPLQES